MNARKYDPYSEISLNIEHYSQGDLHAFFKKPLGMIMQLFTYLTVKSHFLLSFTVGSQVKGIVCSLQQACKLAPQFQSEIISTFLNLITI